jgi:hypothetical protein
LNQPSAAQPCAAFEAWFLDPNCRQTHVSCADEGSSSSQVARRGCVLGG